MKISYFIFLLLILEGCTKTQYYKRTTTEVFITDETGEKREVLKEVKVKRI